MTVNKNRYNGKDMRIVEISSGYDSEYQLVLGLGTVCDCRVKIPTIDLGCNKMRPENGMSLRGLGL